MYLNYTQVVVCWSRTYASIHIRWSISNVSLVPGVGITFTIEDSHTVYVMHLSWSWFKSNILDPIRSRLYVETIGLQGSWVGGNMCIFLDCIVLNRGHQQVFLQIVGSKTIVVDGEKMPLSFLKKGFFSISWLIGKALVYTFPHILHNRVYCIIWLANHSLNQASYKSFQYTLAVVVGLF